MKGVCLDFGFFSIRNLTPQKTIETINMIKKELVIMAISHLRFVIKKGDFDLLYTNRVKNGGNEWEDFAKHDNEKHAKLLQISVEKLKEDYPNEQEMINSRMDEIIGRVESVVGEDPIRRLDYVLESIIHYQFSNTYGSTKNIRATSNS